MESTELNEMESLLLNVERPIFTNQEKFDNNFQKNGPSEKKKGMFGQLKASCCSQCSAMKSSKEFWFGMFPIIGWLSKYSLKDQLLGDIISGCTVAVMHIPQGMGYALLGGVSPIIGLYMAFFPVLIYVCLGTSHHISIGTFAVTSLMTGKIVSQYGSRDYANSSISEHSFKMDNISSNYYTNLEVATAACFMVGIWQTLMGILRLGILGIILSDHLVSGFTTGAAIHVLVSQTTNLLGLKIPRFTGSFQLIRSTVAICGALPKTNLAEVVVSFIAITIMAVHNDWLKPWYGKKMKFPIPTELLVIGIGTAASYLGKLSSDYGINILNHIPTGFPTPRSPPYELFPSIIQDTIPVAIVAYVISLSMAKIFARKRGYEISSNQELIAQGAANVFGAFFSCMPVSTSLSRSMLQESVGGETQLASVVSCALMLIILLWMGPFFESLPLAVLSSVIIVSLKGMFMQFRDFISAVKTSPLDSIVWMSTFLAVVIVDIDIGLGVGVVASVTVLIYRGHRPYAATLGHLQGTEMHVDVELYSAAVEAPGIKIFHWAGAIHFANGETFRHVVDSQLGVIMNPDVPVANIEYLILDCSALSYVDLSGTKILTTLHKDLMKSRGITLVLANCSEPLLQQLERQKYFQSFPKSQVYPSIIDAVMTIESSIRCKNGSSPNSAVVTVD
ncbi:sulfate transporter-like [Daphnia pulex]|uniref:sulfate transporter-like n=1 Tax=Daphnia pulex TaxID=6669 RepID=UPI001EE06B39|nr:sulfate transporter-like [Daphnia pulex]